MCHHSHIHLKYLRPFSIILLIVSLFKVTPINCQYFITADDSYCLAIGTNSLTNNSQLLWYDISQSSICINWGLEQHFIHTTQTIYNGKLYVNGIGANAINQESYWNQRMYIEDTNVNIGDNPNTNGIDEFELDLNLNTLTNKTCALGMSVNDTLFLSDDTTIRGYAARFDCSNSNAVTSVSINITYQGELDYVFQHKMLDFHDSDALCRFNYGAHLASIHNDHQNDQAIAKMSAYVADSWFGLNDLETEGVWANRDGTAWDYGVTTEPDGGNGQNCATLATYCDLYASAGPIEFSDGNCPGTVSIPDTFRISFDFTLDTWTPCNGSTTIHLFVINYGESGEIAFEYGPYEEHSKLYFKFANSGNTVVLDSLTIDPVNDDGKTFHLEALIQPTTVTVSMDGVIVSDHTAKLPHETFTEKEICFAKTTTVSGRIANFKIYQNCAVVNVINAGDPLIESLPNHAFNASSYWDDALCLPHNALRTSPNAWCASSDSNPDDYLEVDLGASYPIESVSVYPRATNTEYPQYVTTYTLSYSTDGQIFDSYPQTLSGPQGMTGNDAVDVANSVLDSPIVARYLRFVPLTASGWKSMRVEAYGGVRVIHEGDPLVESLSNQAFDASSYWDDGLCTPHNARRASGAGWCALTDTNPDEYLEVDLGAQYPIASVSVYPRDTELDQYVTTYTLSYSTSADAPLFDDYPQILSGPQQRTGDDAVDEANSVLQPPIVARYLRFTPVTVQGWKSMRVEAYAGAPIAKWHDQVCQFDAYSLCNHPQHTIIIDEPNDHLPSRDHWIGIMDILDEIYVELDIVIHSWPSDWGNVLHIGNVYQEERFPAIFIHPSGYFEFSFSNIVVSNAVYDVFSIDLDTQYHVTLYHTQQHISITVNGDKVFDEATPSHPVVFNTRIYVSDPWYQAADATLSNLVITASNSYSPNEFNYLCDADNQLSISNGAWLFDTNECTVQSDSDTEFWNVVWLAADDASSANWTDYTLEVTFTIQSGETINLLFRTQSATSLSDRDGYFLAIAPTLSSTDFGVFTENGEHYFTQSTAWKWDYGVTYTVRVEMIGSQFSFYRDDEFLFSDTDANAIYMSGTVGLRTSKTIATFQSMRLVFESDNHLLCTVASGSFVQQCTTNPTINPTINPTDAPIVTDNPTLSPTGVPIATATPIKPPTFNPTKTPSVNPTSSPTKSPTVNPRYPPTSNPSISPTSITSNPTIPPTLNPNGTQIAMPTRNPTFKTFQISCGDWFKATFDTIISNDSVSTLFEWDLSFSASFQLELCVEDGMETSDAILSMQWFTYSASNSMNYLNVSWECGSECCSHKNERFNISAGFYYFELTKNIVMETAEAFVPKWIIFGELRCGGGINDIDTTSANVSGHTTGCTEEPCIAEGTGSRFMIVVMIGGVTVVLLIATFCLIWTIGRRGEYADPEEERSVVSYMALSQRHHRFESGLSQSEYEEDSELHKFANESVQLAADSDSSTND